MKAIIRILPIIALLVAFAACSKREIPGTCENTISLWSGEDGTGALRTRAGETPNRSLQPLFLFWTSGNFNNSPYFNGVIQSVEKVGTELNEHRVTYEEKEDVEFDNLDIFTYENTY